MGIESSHSTGFLLRASFVIHFRALGIVNKVDQELVLFFGQLNQALQATQLHLLIIDIGCSNELGHDEAAVALVLEAALRVRDAVEEGLGGEAGELDHLGLHVHVGDKRLHDAVRLFFGKVLWLEVLAQVRDCCHARELDTVLEVAFDHLA